jgi:hypothetical protein
MARVHVSGLHLAASAQGNSVLSNGIRHHPSVPKPRGLVPRYAVSFFLDQENTTFVTNAIHSLTLFCSGVVALCARTSAINFKGSNTGRSTAYITRAYR